MTLENDTIPKIMNKNMKNKGLEYKIAELQLLCHFLMRSSF